MSNIFSGYHHTDVLATLESNDWDDFNHAKQQAVDYLRRWIELFEAEIETAHLMNNEAKYVIEK